MLMIIFEFIVWCFIGIVWCKFYQKCKQFLLIKFSHLLWNFNFLIKMFQNISPKNISYWNSSCVDSLWSSIKIWIKKMIWFLAIEPIEVGILWVSKLHIENIWIFFVKISKSMRFTLAFPLCRLIRFHCDRQSKTYISCQINQMSNRKCL